MVFSPGNQISLSNHPPCRRYLPGIPAHPRFSDPRKLKAWGRALNRCFPKRKNQILFESHSDYCDNTRAVYDELLRARLLEQEVVAGVAQLDQLGAVGQFEAVWSGPSQPDPDADQSGSRPAGDPALPPGWGSGLPADGLLVYQ